MLTPQRRQQMDAALGGQQSTSVLTPDRKSQMDKILGVNQPSFGQKALTTVGDVLNATSYAVGGVIKEQAENQPTSFWDRYNPIKAVKTLFKGGIQGLQNKTPVMQELPSGLGMDPNSLAGKAVGFAGEMITPNLPLGKAFRALKGADMATDVARTGLVAKGAQKLGTKLEGLSERVATSGLGNPAIQRNIAKIGGKQGQTTAQVMMKYPQLFSRDPGDAQSILSDLYKQFSSMAMKKGGKVDVVNILKPLQSRIDELTLQVAKRPGGKLSKELSQLLENREQIRKAVLGFQKKTPLQVPRITTNKFRQLIDQDIPGSAFAKMGMEPGALAANVGTRRILQKAIAANEPELTGVGLDIARMNQIKKIFENSSARSNTRQWFGLGKKVAAGTGGVVGGLPGAVGAVLVDTLAQSPQGVKALSFATRNLGKGIKKLKAPKIPKLFSRGATTGIRVGLQPTPQKSKSSGKQTGLLKSQQSYNDIISPKKSEEISKQVKMPELKYNQKFSFSKRFKL